MISGSLPTIRCGVGYYTHKLLQELPSDMNLEVMSTKGIKEDLGKATYTVPDWKIGSLPAMIRNIKASNAQIIHIQYPAVGYRRNLGINLLPYALRLLKPRTKILVSLHEYHESRLLGRWRDFITVWPAHQIIVSNQLDCQSLGRLERKTTVIPIGDNFDKAQEDPAVYGQLLVKHKLDASRPVLMFFGFAEPNKRVEVLLDALIEPGLENYQALLLTSLDKDDAYQQMLMARVKELNFAEKRVAVAGFLPDNEVSAVLQEGKYFVLPQQQPLSPKSSTAITAVINGLILISAGSSNPQETFPFENGKNCLLISPMDSAHLAKAIVMIDKDSNAQANLKTGALELAGYFSWPAIVNKHLEVYEKL